MTKLKIRFTWEHRINDHDVPKLTLYQNGKAIYSARYESCVVDYINGRFAHKKLHKLKQSLDKLSAKDQKLRQQIDAIQDRINKPLVKVIRCVKVIR